MLSHTVHRTFDTARRHEFIRITDDAASVVRESAVPKIFYCEFDGGRRERMVIKVLGE